MSRAFLSVLALAVTALVACGGETASAPCSQPPGGSTVALVYRVAAGDARGTAARLCTRLSTPGSERFEVGPVGSDRIRIVARDDEETLAAVDSAIEGTSLRVYDWEPNVLGSRGPAAPFAGGAALFEAVSAADRSEAPPARYYLFGPDRHALGPPAASCRRAARPVRARIRERELPEGLGLPRPAARSRRRRTAFGQPGAWELRRESP